MTAAQKTVKQFLALADITINGTRPYDIQVHDERFYQRVLSGRELGLGESYMDGWWDVDQLDECIARILRANLHEKVRSNPRLVANIALSIIVNRQTVRRAKANASSHYNIGNDLYELMLDKRMIYSCAYWETATTLDSAQEAKLELICQKLHLKKGMTLLDIGCGWGGFAKYAAEKYGVKVTGITPAFEQFKIAKARTKDLPVTILEQDYRDITGSYDRIVSIGMLEHVGEKNYKTFFTRCKNMLNDQGLMLHHTIGGNRSTHAIDLWIDRYIFPGGVIPSITQINQALEGQLIVEDLHNFGPYYDKTLIAWRNNFVKAYPKLKDKYDERFYRMWNYYLLSCAGAFRARQLQLWQIVMRKVEISPVYNAVRQI